LSKLVYIAGPYSGNVSANVKQANHAAIWCAENRVFYICPHMNSAFFDELAPVDFFYEMDLHLLRKCDAILLLPGWEYSKGASGEYNEALTLGLRTFEYSVDCGLLLEWIRENK